MAPCNLACPRPWHEAPVAVPRRTLPEPPLVALRLRRVLCVEGDHFHSKPREPKGALWCWHLRFVWLLPQELEERLLYPPPLTVSTHPPPPFARRVRWSPVGLVAVLGKVVQSLQDGRELVAVAIVAARRSHRLPEIALGVGVEKWWKTNDLLALRLPAFLSRPVLEHSEFIRWANSSNGALLSPIRPEERWPGLTWPNDLRLVLVEAAQGWRDVGGLPQVRAPDLVRVVEVLAERLLQPHVEELWRLAFHGHLEHPRRPLREAYAL